MHQTKFQQHTALPEDPPSLPGSNDAVGNNPYPNLDPVLIKETCLSLITTSPSWLAIHHMSSPEPPIGTSSQSPSCLSVASHTISSVPTFFSPSGPPSSSTPPHPHMYSTRSHTRALKDTVQRMSHHSSCISSACTSLLSSNTTQISELRKELSWPTPSPMPPFIFEAKRQRMGTDQPSQASRRSLE